MSQIANESLEEHESILDSVERIRKGNEHPKHGVKRVVRRANGAIVLRARRIANFNHELERSDLDVAVIRKPCTWSTQTEVGSEHLGGEGRWVGRRWGSGRSQV